MIDVTGIDRQKVSLYSGWWAITPDAARYTTGQAERIDLAAHVAAGRAMPKPKPNAFTGGAAGDTAIVELVGVLSKGGGLSLMSGTSTIEARRQVQLAGRDPRVSKIVLLIDSPGGQVAGTADLAAEVRTAARSKPVIAFIEDMGASAAYWVASQATRIVANRGALVGSIGTYATVYDTSEAAGKAGIKVHVVKAGDFKGVGVPGTPVDDKQLAEMQRVVTGMNEIMVGDIRKARSSANLGRVADGRIHSAAEALALGLIDEIGTLDAVISGAAGGAGGAYAHRPGVEPLACGNGPSHETTGGAIGDYQAAVEAAMAGGMTKAQAYSHVNRTMPDLREAYVAAANEERQQAHRNRYSR